MEQPSGNLIQSFFHCKRCINEKPEDISPRDWASIECGWTVKGIQIWCSRHESNIINIDLKGQKVTAN